MKKNWNGKIQNILHNVILNFPVAEQLKKGTTKCQNAIFWNCHPEWQFELNF